MKKQKLALTIIAAFTVLLGVEAKKRQPNQDTCQLTEKTGQNCYGYIRVKLDKDGNGALNFPASKEGEIALKHAGGKLIIKDSSGEEKAYKNGDTVSIPIRLCGRSSEYKLKIRQIKPELIAFASLTKLEAEYGKDKITLLDSNINGVFAEKGKDKIEINERLSIPFGSSLSLNRELFNIKVRDDESALEIVADKSVKTSLQIKIIPPATKAIVNLRDVKTGACVQIVSSVKNALLPGMYKIAEIKLFLKPKGAGEEVFIMGPGWSQQPEIKIRKGRNTIKIGPPFSIQSTWSHPGGDMSKIKLENAWIMGAGRDYYNSSWLKGKKQVLTTWKIYIKKGRKRIPIGSVGYHCGASMKDNVMDIPKKYAKKKNTEIEIEFNNSGVVFSSSQKLNKLRWER